MMEQLINKLLGTGIYPFPRKEVNLGKYYIIRAFRSETGKTPG